MLKKTAIVGAGVLLLLGLFFGRDACSYVSTAVGSVHDAVTDNVPLEFQIKRAHDMIKELDPEIQKNMHLIAKQDVRVQDLQDQLRDVEEQLAKNERDIKRLNSTALDGLALIEIEFIYGTDPDRKYDEVVREVNVVRPTLPDDVFSVEIRQFTPGTVNIVQFALVSETADWRELAKLAENLEELIETAPGVRRAETWAYPEPEVRIAIDLERLASARVTLGQVIEAVRGENESIPGGAVDVGLRRYNLKTSGSYESLDEIGEGRAKACWYEGALQRREVA